MTYWFDILRKDYIKELELSCNIFNNNIIPVAQKTWEREKRQLNKKIKNYKKRQEMYLLYIADSTTYHLPANFIVPEDYEVDSISEEWQMKYCSYQRIIQLAFSNIVMLWEQQLFDFLKYFDPQTTNQYKMLKQKCKHYTNIDLDIDPKIDEMRHVVNVIKHGTSSKSFQALKEQNSKFLKDEIHELFSDVNERYVYIKINRRDIRTITNHLISFWEKSN